MPKSTSIARCLSSSQRSPKILKSALPATNSATPLNWTIIASSHPKNLRNLDFKPHFFTNYNTLITGFSQKISKISIIFTRIGNYREKIRRCQNLYLQIDSSD